jgi:hypothetical protein
MEGSKLTYLDGTVKHMRQNRLQSGAHIGEHCRWVGVRQHKSRHVFAIRAKTTVGAALQIHHYLEVAR